MYTSHFIYPFISIDGLFSMSFFFSSIQALSVFRVVTSPHVLISTWAWQVEYGFLNLL